MVKATNSSINLFDASLWIGRLSALFEVEIVKGTECRTSLPFECVAVITNSSFFWENSDENWAYTLKGTPKMKIYFREFASPLINHLETMQTEDPS